MDETARTIEGFWAAAIAGIVIAGLWYLSGRNDKGESRFAIALDYVKIFWNSFYVTFIDRGVELEEEEVSDVEEGVALHMSSTGEGDIPVIGDTTANEPVPAPRTTGGTVDITDIPLSVRLSRNQVIILLASQINDDNEYIYGANKIFGLVGGTRKDVLDLIREIQHGIPPQSTAMPPEADELVSVGNLATPTPCAGAIAD